MSAAGERARITEHVGFELRERDERIAALEAALKEERLNAEMLRERIVELEEEIDELKVPRE